MSRRGLRGTLATPRNVGRNMPIYTYQCEACEHIVEFEATASEYTRLYYGKDATCTECGKKAKRVINAAGFVLDGIGWPGKAGKRLAEQRKKEGV